MGVIGSSEMMPLAECCHGFQRLHERLRYRRRKQQAARDQDANHRDPAPTVGEPSHTAVSAQGQARQRSFARHARRFPVNAIMSTQDWPPRHMGIVIDCEVHAEAAPRAAWDRPRDLADGKISNPGRFSRSARSAIDGKSHIPQHPVVIFRQRGDSLFDLALATPIRPPACDGAPDHGQPAGVDKSISVDLARRKLAASLVDGIRDPKAVRSIASSLSSTAISARAEDETSEMDFRRSRRESSGGRRASTSLVIVVTAVVANPCTEAPYTAKPSRKNQNTDSQVASACAVARNLLPEISRRRQRSGGMSRLSRAATREACSGVL